MVYRLNVMELVVHPVRLIHAPPFCEQYILISQGFQKRRTPLLDKIVRKAEFIHFMVIRSIAGQIFKYSIILL